MSVYHFQAGDQWNIILKEAGKRRLLCTVDTEADANRIARALRTLDAIENTPEELPKEIYGSAVNAVVWNGGNDWDWEVMGEAILKEIRRRIQ